MPKYIADFKLSGSLHVRASNLQEAQTASEELLFDIIEFWNDNNPYKEVFMPAGFLGRVRLTDNQEDKDE